MVDEVIQQIRVSRKYRNLCDETVERIAKWALASHPSVKAATKTAKRKLHQVYGAYAGQVKADEIEGLIDGLSLEDLKPGCDAILRQHTSTAERLDILDDLFSALWELTGQPKTVMDLACGFNPFAWPYMQLNDLNYYACDIDLALAGCVTRFFESVGIDGVVESRDLLVSVPDYEVDVAFLFKTLPCLEQQEKGVGLQVLKAVRAPFVVVSFPTHSLGGKDRGMAVHYESVMHRLIRDESWQIQRLSLPGETFYVLAK